MSPKSDTGYIGGAAAECQTPTVRHSRWALLGALVDK
jgi:hypothetical protein